MIDLEKRERALTARIPERRIFDAHRIAIEPLNPQLQFHDDVHSSNVMVYAYHIGVFLDLTPPEMRALLFSASLHDKFRMTDDEEVGHGKKAAEFVERHGISYGIPSDLIHIVSSIVSGHDQPTPKEKALPTVLSAFKDADRLDRVRVGDLDVSRLSIPTFTEVMLPLAEQMNTYTRVDLSWVKGRVLKGHELVMYAGMGLGLIQPFQTE